jgi:hypothetical protein
LPYVDFREVIAGLDRPQQSVVVGRANLTLIERGVVQWSDVVTPSRVRDFREVVALKKLSIRSMVESGVNRSQAEKAYATVHTPHHEVAAQHRKALVDNLIAKGVPKDQIGESFGKGVAGRVTVGKAPGGSTPLTPTPPPSPIKPPAEISPVVAKQLGVKLPQPRLDAPVKEGSKARVKKVKVESPPSYHPDFHAPLPDIKAKMDAYTEGDRKVKALADAAAPAREIRARYDRTLGRVKRLVDAERQATPEELQTIRAERQFAQEDLRKLNGQLQDAERKHRAIAMQIIGVDKGVDFSDVYGTLEKKPNQSFRESAEGAMAYVGKVVAATSHPINLEWEQSASGRAYSGGTSIGMGKEDPVTTAVHELGHVLEYSVPGWHEAAQAYLKHRVGDEKNVPLREVFGDTYRPDERGRKDKFDMAFDERMAYYVGKDYGVAGTEITAMGLEKLFRDPLNFAATDPEYVKFLLGMMDGSLR